MKARVVGLPCWSLFKVQPLAYRDPVLPSGVPTIAIEAGETLGRNSYVGPPGAVIGVDCYGVSAPGEVVMREYGFTVENVLGRVHALLESRKGE